MSALARWVRRLGPGPILGGCLVLVFVLVALLGPSLSPASPLVQQLDQLLQGPSRAS